MKEKLEVGVNAGSFHTLSFNISISNACIATKLCPEDPCGLLNRLCI